MTQPALINLILDKLNVNGKTVKMHDTPDTKTLIKDEIGDKRICDWNYRSVVCMMISVATSTWPDIVFAVHQCAKFSIDPKTCHEEAVKLIGRYL